MVNMRNMKLRVSEKSVFPTSFDSHLKNERGYRRFYLRLDVCRYAIMSPSPQWMRIE